MEDNQLQPADNDDLTSFIPPGSTREFALAKRWRKVAKHATLQQILQVLGKEPGSELYLAEIARTLAKPAQYIRQEIRHLVRTKVVEVEKRSTRTYYRLRPGMAEQYQQWLESQKPMHFLVIELLSQHGEMYETQIVDALKTTAFKLQQGIAPLQEMGIIDIEHRQDASGRKFYRLRAGMAEQYQQWLASQQLDEPEP